MFTIFLVLFHMQMGQISEIETLLFFLAQTSQICLISISARKRTKTHENRLGCLEHYLASALQKARARLGKQRPGHGLGPVFSLPCLGKMDCNLQSGRPGPYFARGHLGAHESARKNQWSKPCASVILLKIFIGPQPAMKMHHFD